MSLEAVGGSLARDTRAAWLRLLEDRPDSRIEVHPDLVAAVTPAGGTAMLYSDGGAELRALAALVPKRVRVVRGASYADRLLSLSGYRLVADAVLGADDPAGLGRFFDEAVDLLDGGRADCHQAIEIGRAHV